MRTALSITLTAVFSIWTHMALAEDQPVVVELFTSQGCSSCPPADALLSELAKRPDVLALALHVDYWDYIGWADDFAMPRNTARQKGYAAAAGTHMVYTPQMMVGGMDPVVGYKPMKIADLIEDHKARVLPVRLTVERTGNMLHLTARATRPLRKPAVVQVMRFDPARTVDIRKGENAGRTITYSNIVTDWERVAEWTGKEALDLELKILETGPMAVIVQETGYGPVLAAARID
ncbi:DUF1223 domain-containing protein [Brevirhabdus sp.]|uniref:DUF1223 domain-containing protein n=1 Tax=Brevirhabdus sp. TaxID=2004514 RepID=UPI0040598306